MAHRILIAVANDRLAAPLFGVLRREGIDAVRARDALEALRLALGHPWSALLIDREIPQLDPPVFCEKLRSTHRGRQIPLIILDMAQRNDASAFSGCSEAACLKGPLRQGALLAAVSRALSVEDEAQTLDLHLRKALDLRFSGELRLRCEDGERRLAFSCGVPVSLRPGFSWRDLGDFLRARGVIGEQEYRYFLGPGGERGETLVQMGCLSPSDLGNTYQSWLSEELVEGFAQGAMQAGRVPAFRTPPGAPGVNLPEVFYRGFHRHPRRQNIQQFLARLGEQFVAPGGNYYRYINFLHLNPEERELLARMDGGSTLSESLGGSELGAALVQTLGALGMCRFSPRPIDHRLPEGIPVRSFFNAADPPPAPPAEEKLESFSDLIEVEVEVASDSELSSASPPPPGPPSAPQAQGVGEKVRSFHAQISGKNYYQIFDLTQARFSFEHLRERYFAITREFGPEILMQLGGEEGALTEEILATVTSAYNTLSDVVKKERYDELLGADNIGLGRAGDDRFHARVQFQSGKVFMEMEEWENAEKALRDACATHPDSGEYLAALAWAIYRNPANIASRAMLDKARQQVNRSISLERTPSGHAYKGWMLLDLGQENLAEAEFNKSLKLDARNSLARSGLRAIEEKRDQEKKKGIFRRLFG